MQATCCDCVDRGSKLSGLFILSPLERFWHHDRGPAVGTCARQQNEAESQGPDSYQPAEDTSSYPREIRLAESITTERRVTQPLEIIQYTYTMISELLVEKDHMCQMDEQSVFERMGSCGSHGGYYNTMRGEE